MRKFVMLVAVTAGGWLGWRIGSPVGVMTGYFLSVVGSGVGVYAAWKLNSLYLD